uniref:Tyr recombinase domain-containing protein n=1 Tax=Mantoniella antarctica TaxID=81844 RepID=A0A7S0X2R7_9CHLO|mmetsp:Transcript_12073/g.29261  ORF Transcript_12073/g.29261 Transcript_12073/m.29261 type:complete len:390 (+) Transcript_12073:375-1544(+)
MGVLTCKHCGEWAHRVCIGLKPWSMLANAFACSHCECWRAWEGGHAAEQAAARTSKAITKLEGEEHEQSTAQTYYYRLNTVRNWAKGEGFAEEDIFPSAPNVAMHELVALGIIAHGSYHWAPSYLEGITAAVGAWHASKRVLNPMASERAKSVVKAAKKRALRLSHTGRGPKTPVSLELLKLYLLWLETQATHIDRARHEMYWRDETWAALGFFGLLRRSELGALKLKDIILEQTAGRLRILIRRSKTDPGHGQSVWIAWRTESGVNIGNIVKRWVDARTANGASPEDKLFTAWNKKENKMSNRPLEAKGEALAQQFRRHLQRMARDCNLDINVKDYAAHSFRRGGANALKEQGATPMEIQEHGRWTSECYRRYLERTAQERLRLTARM